MRFLSVGLLILALPAVALAQARGQVLTVGFNNHYRPDCWTPMLVQLTSESAEAQTFQVQVVQQDLDHDRVTYTQLETLGGNAEGKPATTENFWVYFKPTPTDGGLPDATDLTASLRTLNEQLKVFLCDKDGKQLSTLPLTSTILSVDPPRTLGDPSRSRKLILFVSDGADRPEINDDSQQKGLLQDVDAVTVSPRDLPSNVIGYEGVDAIVWMDADANFLASGTYTPCLEALLQWVRQGGNLVVCQPAEAFKVKPLVEILPVGAQIDGQWTIPMVDRSDLDVLNRLAHPLGNPASWPRDLGPFKVARVPALAGSKVDEWMQWDDGGATSFTPWLARRGDGLGAVTWVAQDLGNADLTRTAKTGWRYVWDRIFDWNNPSDVAEDYQTPAGVDDPWPPASGWMDLGFPLLKGMDLKSTATAYLAIACFFFVVYWLIAGPGTYLFLAARKQAELSWFVFSLAAMAATGVTALLVKAVLRGPPELQHVSIVRCAPADGVSVIDSRFGLYIRQDGLKTISLPDAAPDQVSYLTPFSLHPQYADNSGELASYQEYQIPVRDASDADAVAVSIPYRTTSKKLQAHWVGGIRGSIDLAADSAPLKLNTDDRLIGSLVNHTGYDLWHVFFGFKQPAFAEPTETSARDTDTILYVQKWARGDTLKLQDLIVSKNLMNLEDSTKRQPMTAEPAWGQMGGVQKLAYAWSTFWRDKEDSVAGDLDFALPMLTFFDRLPPWQSSQRQERYELYRRGGRVLDLSPALSAGNLVICARAMVDDDTSRVPLPVPLRVSNEPVSGPGTTIYEFVLPVDRSAVSAAPATKPSAM